MCRGGKPVVEGARDKLSMFCQVNTKLNTTNHASDTKVWRVVFYGSWYVRISRYLVGCKFSTVAQSLVTSDGVTLQSFHFTTMCRMFGALFHFAAVASLSMHSINMSILSVE